MVGRSNSFTRLDLPYNPSGYAVPLAEMQRGYVRSTIHNGRLQSWAVTRPVGPTMTRPDEGLIRSGTGVPLHLRRLRVEMDPTNPMTWQRDYVFTT